MSSKKSEFIICNELKKKIKKNSLILTDSHI